ncbi:MAG TPA: TlpA disulfide reductase family protein [Chitinophagaceae bacterium]|nr:TlpA disulfide reductase family protein [Chitinophagaceae bacterium]
MRKLLTFLVAFISFSAAAQQGMWRAQLHRDDEHLIVFNFEWKLQEGKSTWIIHNGTERISVTDIVTQGDSLIIQMPVFESQFRVKFEKNRLNGKWIRGSSSNPVVIGFTAQPGNTRFASGNELNKNITGRWAVLFQDGKIYDTAVAEFKQDGNKLTGTFMTTSGDYRYLEGVVRNDSLFLSTFDGSHAFSFLARIADSATLTGGWYYSGARFKQNWTARRNDKAAVPSDASAMYLRPGEESLNFTFNDLDGKPVSINDDRYKNKVVVVQLMGSWCPNCMDETAFLSEYYAKNHARGIEIISLAYEYSTDLERSKKTLRRFQQAFSIQYPMLITGVSVSDSMRTEKTLPQLTPIKMFPSSIIIDKKGKVRRIDTDFNGPGTGEHFVAYKQKFEGVIEGLLQEN